MASGILKSQVNAGRRKELYYFRDQQGLEVDFLLPGHGGQPWMIECKAARTVLPATAGPLLSLRRAMGRRTARLTLVHRGAAPSTHALAPGVEALDLAGFVQALA